MSALDKPAPAAEFLRKLATLLDEYEARLCWTVDDDGVHIEIRGHEIFAGFLHCGDAGEVLRQAAQAHAENS